MIKAIKLIKKDIPRINRLDPQHKEADTNVLQHKAKQLLIGFFVLMIILTIISRAVDSITIAQVVTQNPQGSMLTFEADGTGKIIADSKKRLKLQESITIDQINVKIGQEVKKGDVLLTLDQADIDTALASAEREIEKSQNQIEQEELSVTDSYVSELEKYKLLYTNAKTNLLNAQEDYKDAIALRKEKAEALDKAKTDYENALTKSVDDVLRDKKQELAEAKSSYDALVVANEESYQTTSGSLEEAKEALQVLDKKDKALQDYLVQYESKDTEAVQKALEGLYCIAYGDEDSYNKHKKNVRDLEVKLARATDDYIFSVKSSYQDEISANRAISDAKENLAAENEKETIIKTELNNYIAEKALNGNAKAENALLKINQCIYGITGYPKHITDKEKADKKVARLQNYLTSLQDKNSLSLSAAKGKLTILTDVIDSIEEGTYDPKTAVSSEKQALDTSRQELKAQLLAVTTAKRAITTAKASSLTAKLDYDQSREKDNNNTQAISRQQAAADLRISSIQLTIEEKQQAVTQLKALKKNKGMVTAPVDGTIDSISAEAGKKTTADSAVSINTGSFSISVTVARKEGEYVSIGNEMVLTQKGRTDPITVNVEGLRFTADAQGNEIAEITAVMPDGDYIPGSVFDAKINNNSDLYDVCIPIEALRNNGAETYCLVAREKDTVLGKELLAEKVPVTLIEKDARTAAVSGSLQGRDDIIISSNKNVSVGDRVRKRQ